MSTANGFESGEKIEISGPQFWQRVELHYSGNGKSVKSRLRWRRLAMFHLYSACGWTCEMLAHAFNVERCNVSRQMAQLKKHFEEIFRMEQSQRTEEQDYDAKEDHP